MWGSRGYRGRRRVTALGGRRCSAAVVGRPGGGGGGGRGRGAARRGTGSRGRGRRPWARCGGGRAGRRRGGDVGRRRAGGGGQNGGAGAGVERARGERNRKEEERHDGGYFE
jgi:hypothetical protein